MNGSRSLSFLFKLPPFSSFQFHSGSFSILSQLHVTNRVEQQAAKNSVRQGLPNLWAGPKTTTGALHSMAITETFEVWSDFEKQAWIYRNYTEYLCGNKRKTPLDYKKGHGRFKR